MFSGDLVEHTGFEPVTPTLPVRLLAFYVFSMLIKTNVFTKISCYCIMIRAVIYQFICTQNAPNAPKENNCRVYPLRYITVRPD